MVIAKCPYPSLIQNLSMVNIPLSTLLAFRDENYPIDKKKSWAIIKILRSLKKVTHMARNPIGNRTLIRALNRSSVLNTVKNAGPIARTDIARITGLSPATVTAITFELIEDNLVFEKAAGDSSGGRRPILLALNPRGGYVVGIKLTEHEAIGALTDLEATIITRRTQPWEGSTPEDAVLVMSRLVHALAAEKGVRRKQLLGVGVGLAGIVDAERGILRSTPYFNWFDLPLRDLLQASLKLPVYIDNDVNTFTLAEKWFGSGKGIDDFLTVTIGRGVGMGIVVNGQLYRGVGGGAGELGHTVVDPLGPPCPCGKRGCLEAYIGDQALIQSAQSMALRSELPAIDNPQALVDLAESGEATAQQILAQAGEKLGIALANLINLFNPELIIISGEGTRAGELLFQAMRRAIHQNTIPGLVKDSTIHIEPWGDAAWARGAASLVLGELFQSPVHSQESVPAG
jgi:predicted NBD/HSP70 family sugar kinase